MESFIQEHVLPHSQQLQETCDFYKTMPPTPDILNSISRLEGQIQYFNLIQEGVYNAILYCDRIETLANISLGF